MPHFNDTTAKWLAASCAASILIAGFFLFIREEAAPPVPPVPPSVRVPAQPAEAHLIFGGDMQFDRAVRTTARAYGSDYLFSCIDTTLASSDVAIANLEGPITNFSSKSEGSRVGSTDNYRFTFPTSTATLLYDHNVRIVNIGNNHIMDFGRIGLLETKQYLDGAYVAYLGDPDASESDKVVRFTIHGIPMALVNWSDWNSDNTDHTVAQVAAEVAQGRIVMVYTHWGQEYVAPLPRVRALAHAFIDAGASLVVGSHPHVVQEHERYHGKDIYYSLGNFIFDQFFSDAVDHGLLLRVTLTKEGIKNIDELPIVIDRQGRPCLQ